MKKYDKQKYKQFRIETTNKCYEQLAYCKAIKLNEAYSIFTWYEYLSIYVCVEDIVYHGDDSLREETVPVSTC